MQVALIIPVINERESIGSVLNDLPPGAIAEVVVVDNGSTDGTLELLASRDVTLLQEPRRGYGAACWRGVEYLLQQSSPPEAIVFLDGDYSDFPGEITTIIAAGKGCDLVIGSRLLGHCEPGALLPQARFGNMLACWLLRVFTGYEFTDLGPFRLIKTAALRKMAMQDRTFGWTVEMQIKAAMLKMKTTEVPVSYRKRGGVSKITGTFWGTIRAGTMIIYTIFLYAFWQRPSAGSYSTISS